VKNNIRDIPGNISKVFQALVANKIDLPETMPIEMTCNSYIAIPKLQV